MTIRIFWEEEVQVQEEKEKLKVWRRIWGDQQRRTTISIGTTLDSEIRKKVPLTTPNQKPPVTKGA